MAILDEFTVNVLVNDQPCQEYYEDKVIRYGSKDIINYIEAVPGAQYKISVEMPSSFVFTTGVLLLKASIDGHLVVRKLVLGPDSRLVRGEFFQTAPRDGRRPFFFNIPDDNRERIGTILVEGYRIDIPGFQWDFPRYRLDIPEEPPEVGTSPFIAFKFKYCSKRMIQTKLSIPFALPFRPLECPLQKPDVEEALTVAELQKPNIHETHDVPIKAELETAVAGKRKWDTRDKGDSEEHTWKYIKCSVLTETNDIWGEDIEGDGIEFQLPLRLKNPLTDTHRQTGDF